MAKKTDLKVNYSLAIAKNIEITYNYIKNRHSQTEIMRGLELLQPSAQRAMMLKP